MNTRNIASEYRLSHWADILRERSVSGMSVKEFCKKAGFHENSYYYWQRKLREATCDKLVARAQGQNEEASSETALVPSGWAVCKTAKPADKDNVVAIEIGGFRILAKMDTDSELLTKVCRTLRSLC